MTVKAQKEEVSYSAKSLSLVGDNVVKFPDFKDSKGREYYFDEVTANRWVNFFERYITHTEGHLKGRKLLLMSFWKGAIRRLFGWKQKANGLRRYRTVFWFVPRKNAKTLMTAGLALGLISIDNEPGAKVYVSASTEKQAQKMFSDCVVMCTQKWKDENGKEIPNLLAAKFVVFNDHILHVASGSELHIISGTPDGKTGFNVHAAIIDEYHEQPNSDLKSVLQTGNAARLQPLTIMITTAGKWNEESPCYKEYLKAKDVIDDPRKYPTYFALVFEARMSCDPGSLAAWEEANPGLYQSVQLANLEDEWENAQQSPAEFDKFLQFHLNLWVSKSSQYIVMDMWEELVREFMPKDLIGETCFGGLDLGGGTGTKSYIPDLTAFSLLFPEWTEEEREDEDPDGNKVIETIDRVKYKHLVWFWTPEGVENNARKHFERFINLGEVECTKGNVHDYALIRQRLNWIKKTFDFDIKEVGVDPWHANEMITNLQGKDHWNIVRVIQGPRTMSPAVERFPELIQTAEIEHNGNACMDWCLRNARTISDKLGNRLVSKVQSLGKIDGVQSCLNAVRVAMDAPPPVKIKLHLV